MRLEFLGRQDPQVEFLDDISVTAPAVSAPTWLPSSLFGSIAGLACVGWYMRRRPKRDVTDSGDVPLLYFPLTPPSFSTGAAPE
jgi:hypothetical protein